MATGRSNQITKQIGESLAVAELGKRGFIATAFAGNVPDIDILAIGPTGKTIPIQVKAIRGESWQFSDVRQVLLVDLEGDTQVVRGKVSSSHKNLICIFIRIGQQQADEFYVFRWRTLQEYCFRHYKGGRRPRNPQSFHCAIWPRDLKRHKDKWQLITGPQSSANPFHGSE
jgi:hypothetical protein